MKSRTRSRQSNGRSRIGERLYVLRKERNWTQGDLAKRCEVAVSTISKIENGQLSPSFETLLRLAEGLSITITDLTAIGFNGPNKTRRSYTRKGGGEIHRTASYNYELLCCDISNKIMHPLVARLKAHSIAEFGELFAHPGEELFYVLEGEVELRTEHYEPLRLSVGDCAYYDSTMGHACLSVGSKDAVIFWVSTVTPPR